MRDFRRPPPGRVLACSLAALTVTACGLNQQGVPPPRDRISFPGSALVDPDGQWLYVANSNSDLRYNNGTLVAVDLAAAADDRNEANVAWSVCPSADYIDTETADEGHHTCCWDYLDHTILDCDERNYVNPDNTAIIGSFSAGMVFQPFTDSSCATRPNTTSPKLRHDCDVGCPTDPTAGRLFIGVRGNSSITYVDTARVGGMPRFTCKGASASCAIEQTIEPAGTAPVLLPDEPYALSLDNEQDLLYVGHLRGDTSHPSTGGISLFDVSRPSGMDDAPTYIGPSGSFFPADANGNFGITSLTKRPQTSDIYASSRYTTSVVGVATVTPPVVCGSPDASSSTMKQEVSPTTFFVEPDGDTFTAPLVGAEIRGIQFGPDSDRAFVLQRTPPALIGFDLADGRGGIFGNVPTDVLETCQSPTFLQRNQNGDDLDMTDLNLYVTCFDSGQVYVFDPTVPRLTNVIEVGGGPAGLAFAKQPPHGETKTLAYVVGFSENNISVVDLTPNSETRFHVIQRIGFPSPTPR